MYGYMQAQIILNSHLYTLNTYFICGHLLNYPSNVCGGFYPQIFADPIFFAIPTNDHDFFFTIICYLINDFTIFKREKNNMH
jgi:hypothetical protein